MVSNASDDFPEPDSPVITTSLSRGMSTSMFFRLCSRALLMTIFFIAMGTGCAARRLRATVALRPRRVARSDFQRGYPNTECATASSRYRAHSARAPFASASRAARASATCSRAGRRAGTERDRRVDAATDVDRRLAVAPRDRVLTRVEAEQDQIQQARPRRRDQQRERGTRLDRALVGRRKVEIGVHPRAAEVRGDVDLVY